jgi:hypothetical protein
VKDIMLGSPANRLGVSGSLGGRLGNRPEHSGSTRWVSRTHAGHFRTTVARPATRPEHFGTSLLRPATHAERSGTGFWLPRGGDHHSGTGFLEPKIGVEAC